ncbi:MAG: ABC transporter permease [Acidobacteriota bacterium]
MSAFRRLLSWFRRGASLPRREADLNEELRFHLEAEADERREAGLSDRAAVASARRDLGNLSHVKEEARAAWGWSFLDGLVQDLRFGARTLGSDRTFTVAAILSLALGIGANTAIFSVIHSVMLRELPIKDPQRLVQIRQGQNGELTNPIWEQIRDHQRVLDGTLAYSPERFDLSEGVEREDAQGIWVSGGYFHVLGVPAMMGRVLTSADDDRRSGSASNQVAVISDRFWKRKFGGGEVIGRTLRVNRQRFEIVGVTPPWFRGLDADRSYDIAIPLAAEPLIRTDRSALDNRSMWWLYILGRLKPGASVESAGAQLSALSRAVFAETLPADWSSETQANYLSSKLTLRGIPTGFSETGDRYERGLWTLMGIAGLVLLIACANIANLMLARASARQRELSVRMAIGARRLRVLRQLLTESLLLAALGSAAGFLFAMWGSRLLVGMLSGPASGVAIDLYPDAQVLAFTMGVTVLTALLFGLAPSVRATRTQANPVMKESSHGIRGRTSRAGLGKALVALQVALSLVLLVGAGMFLGSLRKLLAVDVGFSKDNLLLVSADARQTAIPDERRVAAFDDALQRIRAIPGVDSAATSLITALSGRGWNGRLEVEGFVPQTPRDAMAFFNRVSPGYFHTMRTPLLIGRDFTQQDHLHAPAVAIIDASSAAKFFGGRNPIGKSIAIRGPAKRPAEIYEVVGVVKDVKYASLSEAKRYSVYLSSLQDPLGSSQISYEIRVRGLSNEVVPAVREAFAAVDANISIGFGDMESQVDESVRLQRLVALLSVAFGVLALVLAMVGLYGVTSYSVARRRSEIGIRMALGARAASVVWLVLRGVAVLMLIGIALGLWASIAAGKLVESLLFDVKPNDTWHIAAAALTLAVASAAAAYLPARRASRLDPMEALREE